MVDGLNKTSFTPDQLIAGEFDRETVIGLITGAAAYVRGTVMGRTVTGGAVVGAIAPANFGDGVFAGAAALAGAQVGVYRIVCIEAAANGGIFEVFDPKGISLGHYAVAAAAFAIQVAFTIADGANDFKAGDAFTITIAAGVEKFTKAIAAAVDGSQDPVAILAEDVDVTAADKKASLFLTGEFAKSALTFGAGLTAAGTLWQLAQKNIYLRDTVGA